MTRMKFSEAFWNALIPFLLVALLYLFCRGFGPVPIRWQDGVKVIALLFPAAALTATVVVAPRGWWWVVAVVSAAALIGLCWVVRALS